MKRWMLSLAMVVALLASIVTPSMANAATTGTVTVTAQGLFVAITDAPATWTINGSSDSGNGFIYPNTTYYSNPAGGTTAPAATVLDASCEFTVTNASSRTPNGLTLTVTWPAFTGGDAMAQSGTGSAGATSFGSYCYYSGMTFANKVVCNTSSAAMTSNWNGSTLKWGVQINTQTNAWASGAAETSTITITAAAS